MTRAFKERARELLEEPDLKTKHQRHVARYPDGALSMFLYGHAYGKPKDTVDMSGSIAIRWIDDGD